MVRCDSSIGLFPVASPLMGTFPIGKSVKEHVIERNSLRKPEWDVQRVESFP